MGFEAKSLNSITLLLLIGVERILMDVEEVKNEIPLLISEGAMKQRVIFF